MANTWFVDRDGDERGPFTAQQLKAMAVNGDVRPSDLVRRDDATDWRLASSVKGLFEPIKPVTPQSPPVLPSVRTMPRSAVAQSKNTLPKKMPVLLIGGVAGLLFLCCGGCGIMAFFGHRAGEQFKKEMAEADTLWQSGKKAEAVAIYRAKKDSAFFDGSDRAAVYGRLIDYEYDNGNAGGGKALIDEAGKIGVTPVVTHTDAKGVVVAMQAEKARLEAERKERERQKAAEKKRAETNNPRDDKKPDSGNWRPRNETERKILNHFQATGQLEELKKNPDLYYGRN